MGTFSHGQVEPTDEGDIKIAVARDKDNVRIEFGKPVAWLAFPREQATALAKLLFKHAGAKKVEISF